MFGPAKYAQTRDVNKDRSHDRFFTKSNIADTCVNMLTNHVKVDQIDCYFEPSVGEGAFVNALVNNKSILQKQKVNSKLKIIINDLYEYKPSENAAKYVIETNQMDFLKYQIKDLSSFGGTTIAVIGNPPFGKNASLAVKFFNHAAEFATIIAFVLPRSFRKPSILNRLDRKFHLISETILGKDCFEYVGKSVNVPCVWQIWKSDEHGLLRELIKIGPTRSNLVSFSKAPDNCTMMIQRVGDAAGKVTWDKELIKKKKGSRNYYFVVLNVSEEQLNKMQKFDMRNFPGKYDTAGMPSITKPDVVAEIHAYL